MGPFAFWLVFLYMKKLYKHLKASSLWCPEKPPPIFKKRQGKLAGLCVGPVPTPQSGSRAGMLGPPEDAPGQGGWPGMLGSAADLCSLRRWCHVFPFINQLNFILDPLEDFVRLLPLRGRCPKAPAEQSASYPQQYRSAFRGKKNQFRCGVDTGL